MITAKIAGRKDLETILLDNEIYDRVTDDNCPAKEDFVYPDTGYINIGGYVDDKIASLFIVHDGKMHFMVLKPFRKYARLLLKESFKLYPHKVYVEIPSMYMGVINFAKRFGFKQTKVTTLSHKKNNKLFDVHTLTFGV